MHSRCAPRGRASELADRWSYPALVKYKFGRWGALALELAIVANNTGLLLVYLIILGARRALQAQSLFMVLFQGRCRRV